LLRHYQVHAFKRLALLNLRSHALLMRQRDAHKSLYQIFLAWLLAARQRRAFRARRSRIDARAHELVDAATHNDEHSVSHVSAERRSEWSGTSSAIARWLPLSVYAVDDTSASTSLRPGVIMEELAYDGPLMMSELSKPAPRHARLLSVATDTQTHAFHQRFSVRPAGGELHQSDLARSTLVAAGSSAATLKQRGIGRCLVDSDSDEE
jgi:hypothetical protein